MLTKLEALHFKGLNYVSQTVAPFQVLIGPNASGKSTFLDVITLIRDVIASSTPAEAVASRARDIHDLTWKGESAWFELALEAQMPESLRQKSASTHLRYEIRLGVSEITSEIILLAESLWLLTPIRSVPKMPLLFPSLGEIPLRLTRNPSGRTPSGWRKIVDKTLAGNDYFRAETTEWNNMFRLGPKRSALANLPEDETRFPAATWFKRFVAEGVQRIMLNSEALRRPSPPQNPRLFLPDGSNLPQVIHDLLQKAPDRFQDWIAHIQTALPDLTNITVIERPEDRHKYLVLHYGSDFRVPSWMVSDGTLRMLALTILAYLPDLEGVYLIEEPENGIHPRAVETVYQSLSSVYLAQLMLATHSPIILNMTAPHQLLCFARTDSGETDIVRGDEHPNLREWQQEVNLGTLFAGGVLG